MKKYLIAAFLLFAVCTIHAQDDIDISPPEKFVKQRAHFRVAPSIDSLRESVVDSFENPKGYILYSSWKDKSGAWTIAVKTGLHYRIFDPLEFEDSLWFAPDAIKLERAELNNRGKEELIIRWTQRYGASWQLSGQWWFTKGVQIWDLTELTNCMSYTCMFCHDEWWADDGNGESGSKSVCHGYQVTINKSQISIELTNICEPEGSNGDAPEDKEIVYFEFTRNGIQRKQ
jgi:hypothetical protein